MATFELKLPKLGESVTEGTLGKWLKQPGERIEKYDLLVEVQTDKVNTEIPSPVSGTLKEIKVREGDTVPNGALLALIEVEEAAGAPGRDGETKAPTAAPAAKQPAARAGVVEAPRPAAAPTPVVDKEAARPGPGSNALAPAASRNLAPGESKRVGVATEALPPGRPPVEEEERGPGRATPVVRRLAAEHGIDLGTLRGTGLGGRVTRKDVEDAIAARRAAPAAAPAAAERPAPAPRPLAGDQLVPLTQMRKAVARNLAQSWAAPHAHAVMEVDMTNVMRQREQVRSDFAAREGFELSPAAFVLKAAVEALRTVPLVNASWTDSGILLRKDINVGYAVALGDEGLVVPVIKKADEKSIAGLMRAIRDVVDRAKARKLNFDDFEGGTFTLNNTGPLGTVVSSPVLVPGQAAIVSSEAIRKRLVVTDEDHIAVRQMMNLVIGFDHRVIDGATAARFLATMRDWLQAVGPAVPVY